MSLQMFHLTAAFRKVGQGAKCGRQNIPGSCNTLQHHRSCPAVPSFQEPLLKQPWVHLRTYLHPAHQQTCPALQLQYFLQAQQGQPVAPPLLLAWEPANTSMC